MNYGLLTYSQRPMRTSQEITYLNIGDPIQTFAMKYIYSKLGIADNTLIHISRYHTREYKGEKVLLPFNCFNRIFNQLGLPYQTLPASQDIIPFFWSFHLHSRVLGNEIINHLKMYQPIGCRDEETMINMKNHGISCYLSGCATALLPIRLSKPKKQKVFFIDIPNSLKPFIPEEFKKNAEYLTHYIEFKRLSDCPFMTSEEYNVFYQIGVMRLERYKREASLVVTSRLHAAAPCIAMGIPVILVSENFDGRFSWIDKYLPLYTPDQFDKINWYPKYIDYEETKEWMIKILEKQLKNQEIQQKDIDDWNTYYLARPRQTYNIGLRNQLKASPFWKKEKLQFGIWGTTTMAETFKNLLLDLKPEWLFTTAIDKVTNGYFEGVPISNIEDIKTLRKDLIYFIFSERVWKEFKNLLDYFKIPAVLIKEELFHYNKTVLQLF